jgi:hypothetical protein
VANKHCPGLAPHVAPPFMDRERAASRGAGQHGWGGPGRKGPGGGANTGREGPTGALCTGFTLVYINEYMYKIFLFLIFMFWF